MASESIPTSNQEEGESKRTFALEADIKYFDTYGQRIHSFVGDVRDVVPPPQQYDMRVEGYITGPDGKQYFIEEGVGGEGKLATLLDRLYTINGKLPFLEEQINQAVTQEHINAQSWRKGQLSDSDYSSSRGKMRELEREYFSLKAQQKDLLKRVEPYVL